MTEQEIEKLVGDDFVLVWWNEDTSTLKLRTSILDFPVLLALSRALGTEKIDIDPEICEEPNFGSPYTTIIYWIEVSGVGES